MSLVVSAAEAGETIDALLTGRGGLPAAVFREVLERGGVLVNRRRAERGDLSLAPKDVVVAHVLARGRPEAGPPTLPAASLLFIDDGLVAVDKPPGIPAQGTESNASGGLDSAVRALLAARGEKNLLVSVVHRLDIESSGVTLLARTPEATRDLSAQFREGLVEKRYRALVRGHVLWESREVDEPIAADATRSGSFRVSPRGRPARTAFLAIDRLGVPGSPAAASLIEARPATGRTHQIRIHAAHIGHPLLGDRRYGGPEALTTTDGTRIEARRVCLHALAVTFRHPRKGPLTVEAPWPADMYDTEHRLRTAP